MQKMVKRTIKKSKKLSFFPKTWLGKLSIGLIGIFFLLILVVNVIVLLQVPRNNQTFFDNPLISIPMFCAGISVILAFFTGLIAIIKHKEIAILVFLTTLLGFLVLIFILGEFLSPH